MGKMLVIFAVCVWYRSILLKKAAYLKTDAEISQIIDSGVQEQVVGKHTFAAHMHVFLSAITTHHY